MTLAMETLASFLLSQLNEFNISLTQQQWWHLGKEDKYFQMVIA